MEIQDLQADMSTSQCVEGLWLVLGEYSVCSSSASSPVNISQILMRGTARDRRQMTASTARISHDHHRDELATTPSNLKTEKWHATKENKVIGKSMDIWVTSDTLPCQPHG